MSYAIFRSESINTIKDLGQIGAHNKRDKKAYKSNPDIDITRTKNNIDIVPLSEKYSQGFYELVKDYKKEYDEKQLITREDRRKPFDKMLDDSNSVVADELMFTSDNEFFKNMSKKDIKKWADTCMDFVYEDLGYEKWQVLHATVHMDEKTPHLHCVVVPLIKKFDKRTNTEKYTISKKHYMKSGEYISELQDKYWKRMNDNGFKLERGIKNSDNEHISIKEFKKLTRKLDARMEKQNHLMTRDYEILEEFKELEDYTKNYREMEREKHNVEVEVRKLEHKNDELRDENRKLHNFLNVMLQTLKKFFNKLLHIGTEKDKDDVVKEITAYHSLDYYNDRDLHDIADGTPREEEINDYIYEQNYSYDKDYDDKDIDI